MSQLVPANGIPVRPEKVQIGSIGVRPLDLRRVDVAVDLTPCTEPVKVEIVIVGPGGEELCSVLLVHSCEWAIDKIMHLRQDAQPGEHVLHVGVFFEDRLVARAARRFAFALGGAG